MERASVDTWVRFARSRPPSVGQFSTIANTLATFQTWGSVQNTHHASLFRLAMEPVSKHTESFLELALEVDPDHPDIEQMRERNPEGYALLTQLQMRSYIAASQEAPQASAPLVATRRLRTSI